jgi:hypothetical protein
MPDWAPARLRYRGTIAPLHALCAAFADLGLAPELAPGPTPDVTIVVHTQLRPDGADRMTTVLREWHRDHPDVEVEELRAPAST